MNKNSIIGYVLLGILFVAFSMYSSKKANEKREAEEQAKQEQIEKARQDSIANASSVQIPDTANVVTQPAAVPDSATLAMQASIQHYVLENDKLRLTLSNKGGRIIQAEMLDYLTYETYLNEGSTPVQVYNEDHSRFNWNIDGQKTDDIVFQVEELTNGIRFTNGNIVQEYRFDEENPYLLDYDIDFGSDEAELDWSINFIRQEKDMRTERDFTFAAYKPTNSKFKKFKKQKAKVSKDVSEDLNFITLRQRFFNQTILGEAAFSDTKLTSSFDSEDDVNIRQLEAETTVDLNNGKANLQILISPNDRQILKSVDKHLVNIQPKGVFGLTKALAGLFNLIKGLFSSYGLLIVLMTVVIKLVLTPLTYRSYLSQAKMGVLKPEVAELNNKYKDDKARASQEQMKLYSKAGVNPVGGCIPSLLQIPIFFSLYYFFRTSIYFRQKEFLWAEDLSTFDSVIQLPFTIPLAGSHISIFAILYGVALFFSMRLTTSMSQGFTGAAQTPGKKDDMANMMQSQMKIMQYAMPVFLPFIFNAFPVALTFYYFCYNVINALQTLVIKKFVIDEDKIRAKIQENKKKPEKKGGFRKRLEEAMKAQQEMQKQQGKKK